MGNGVAPHAHSPPGRLRERKAFGTESEYVAMSMYAARKVIEALGNMFGNAKAVMDWLNECAREIAHHEESVRWRTPVGLPVVQPYRKHGARSVHTVLQTFTVPCVPRRLAAGLQCMT